MNAPLMCANIVTEDTKAGGWKKKGTVLSNSDSQGIAHQIGSCEENKENIGPLTGTMTDSIGICESQNKVFDVKAALRHTLDRRVRRIDSEKVISKPSLLDEILCTEILLSKHKKAICIVPNRKYLSGNILMTVRPSLKRSRFCSFHLYTL